MKKIQRGGIALLLFLISCFNMVSAYAMEEGTYTVPLIVTYANPQTGEIVDGGSNEALGTSMCQSVMQAEALIEQNRNIAYVTLGIGLSSNISSTEVLVQKATETDEYEAVTLTETGTCIQNDDTCIHYRFAMEDLELLISPVLFVEPMGREVQFFVQLDIANAVEGTGNFLSEMREVIPEPEEENVEVDTALDVEEIVEDIQEEPVNNSSEKSNVPILILIIFGFVSITVICIYIRRRRKGDKDNAKED